MTGPDTLVVVIGVLIVFCLGMAAGVLLCAWMMHSSRRLEREILRGYGIKPESHEPGS